MTPTPPAPGSVTDATLAAFGLREALASWKPCYGECSRDGDDHYHAAYIENRAALAAPAATLPYDPDTADGRAQRMGLPPYDAATRAEKDKAELDAAYGPAATLDVERLARALVKVSSSQSDPGVLHLRGFDRYVKHQAEVAAAAIAAAYAATEGEG